MVSNRATHLILSNIFRTFSNLAVMETILQNLQSKPFLLEFVSVVSVYFLDCPGHIKKHCRKLFYNYYALEKSYFLLYSIFYIVFYFYLIFLSTEEGRGILIPPSHFQSLTKIQTFDL